LAGETYSERLPCGLLEVVLDSKKRLIYEPRIPPIVVPIFDGETSHLIPKKTAFFRDWERLEERDLVQWTLGEGGHQEIGGNPI